MPDSHATTAAKIIAALQAERKRVGWSLETLAVAAGVSDSCIRHLEHQRATPTLVTLLKLASALELDLSILLRTAQKGDQGRK
ncbi:MAG: helix-turn-helix transcriptional regulator [Verrucomicrobia bacterium]|nr:helix-turn-helix transcriptional regulator [Verrucomicrobiota bacterium]